MVARAIYNSEIPVISAVGHETDYTIADFVADLRAPTPSAAAELAVHNVSETIIKLENYNNRLKNSLRKKVELMSLRYEKCMTRGVFKEPLQKINERYIAIDIIVRSMQTNIVNKLKDYRIKMTENITKLDALSPLKTMTRGYSIVKYKDKNVKSSKEIKKDDEIEIQFYDGSINAKIL